MRTVTVKTDELIKIVKENRDVHRETFLKAQEIYRERMIAELDQMLQDARRGGQVRRGISMPEPQDHTDDYDRVVRMLELHTGGEVELDEHEAAQYVMDDWGWKSTWNTTTASYVAKT